MNICCVHRNVPLLKKKPSDYMRDMYYSSQPMEIQDMEAMECTFRMIRAAERPRLLDGLENVVAESCAAGRYCRPGRPCRVPFARWGRECNGWRRCRSR